VILRETYQVDSKEEHAMTAGPSIEPARFWHEQLSTASPDLLRDLLATFIDALMGAEVDGICGAEYGARTAERVNTRNGYRHRDFDTRVGTMDVRSPSCAPGPTSPTGCSSGAAGLRRP